MVPESGDRPECLSQPAMDSDAVCLTCLWRSEVYSRAIQVSFCLPFGSRLRSHRRRALSASLLERDRGLGSPQPAHGRTTLDLWSGVLLADSGPIVRVSCIHSFAV